MAYAFYPSLMSDCFTSMIYVVGISLQERHNLVAIFCDWIDGHNITSLNAGYLVARVKPKQA